MHSNSFRLLSIALLFEVTILLVTLGLIGWAISVLAGSTSLWKGVNKPVKSYESRIHTSYVYPVAGIPGH